MTWNAQELISRLDPEPPRRGRDPAPAARGLRGRLAGQGRLIALGVIGAAIVAGVLVDHPAPRPGPLGAAQAGDRFVISPDALPATADGRPLTFGELFDLYGLEDECLRRSLEATFQRPFSLDDARRYRTVAVGRTSVTVVLRPEPAGS